MRTLETRTLGVCRIQIAEQSAMGWTVMVFPPDSKKPLILQSDQPTGLARLIEQAEARAGALSAGRAG
ncbi:hypothetical protein [Roseomonas populi]|uniref:Uncharacterized protein n=1 Tax=Roseomonas populi TaxID=3121582 RepID=A0ABT1XCH5_9PROT|nr:hypothetical protein [Roseomonas pecuniae]MCR0985837.1 hypothetical protein [Roseomonas pecuniae]